MPNDTNKPDTRTNKPKPNILGGTIADAMASAIKQTQPDALDVTAAVAAIVADIATNPQLQRNPVELRLLGDRPLDAESVQFSVPDRPWFKMMEKGDYKGCKKTVLANGKITGDVLAVNFSIFSYEKLLKTTGGTEPIYYDVVQWSTTSTQWTVVPEMQGALEEVQNKILDLHDIWRSKRKAADPIAVHIPTGARLRRGAVIPDAPTA